MYLELNQLEFAPGTTAQVAVPNPEVRLAYLDSRQRSGTVRHRSMSIYDGVDFIDYRGALLAATGDDAYYLSADFLADASDPSSTYEMLGMLNPAEDPRAAFLLGHELSAPYGDPNRPIFEVRRIASVEIIGQLTEDSSGLRFATDIGPNLLQKGWWLVRTLTGKRPMWLMSDMQLTIEFLPPTPQESESR